MINQADVPADSSANLARCAREYELAQAQGENMVWWRKHQEQIFRQRSEWHGKWLAFCSRTEQKVLAVGDDRGAVADEALQAVELQQLAAELDVPATVLFTLEYLGVDRDWK